MLSKENMLFLRPLGCRIWRRRGPGHSEAPLQPGKGEAGCCVPLVKGDQDILSEGSEYSLPQWAEQGVEGVSWSPLLRNWPCFPAQRQVRAGPGEGAGAQTWSLPLRELGETASSWSPSPPRASVSSFVLWLFTRWSFHLPLSFLLLRGSPPSREGEGPPRRREFVQTEGMAGTSDWLVRPILFPGCHSSHFPRVVSDETHNIVFK